MMTGKNRLICFLIVVGFLFVSLGYAAETVSKKRLRGHVEALTAIQPPRDYTYPASLNEAAALIYEHFRACGAPRLEYREYTVKGKQYKNVIASFGPEKGERIVVGAHYDVCGEQPGADDNATGTAAIMEIATLFSRLKPELKYRVDLVAYSLEEPPHFRTPDMGSAVHAKSLAEAGVKVRMMVSVDMIGYFSKDAKPLNGIESYIEPGSLVPGGSTVLVGKTGDDKAAGRFRDLMAEGAKGIAVVKLIAPQKTPGVDWSDHLNFWNHGYPGLMLTNFFICPNPHYHKPEDTIEKLDFKKIAQIVNGVYHAVLKF